MENKNIILLKHHPMNVKFINPFYLNQTDDGDLSDYLIIDVTSRVELNKEFMKEHPRFAKDLSPFFIGPVVSSDGVVANIFEIFWQCGKVYPCHNDNGKPNEDFFKWRNEFYSKEVCSKDLMRHSCKSLGYEHKDTMYFAHYEDNEWKALDYLEARKKVYFPEYAKLICKTDSFKWLKGLCDNGVKIALVDFDAINIYSKSAKVKAYESYVNKCKKNGCEVKLTVNDFDRINTVKDLVDCSFMQVGHGVCIKALLQGDIEVVDGKVIDHCGILK